MALGTSEALGNFLLFGEGSAASPASALTLYEKSTAVSVPVNIASEAFSIAPPSLLIDGRVIKEHEVLDLLKKPSPWHSTELFLDILAKNYLVTGECHMVALGNVNRPPLELIPLSPKTSTPTREGVGNSIGSADYPHSWHVSGNTLAGTYLGDGTGRYFDGLLREFMQIRAFSTRDNSLLRGQSPLLSASREARSHILTSDHNVQILERGGRVSLVFSFDENMDDDDFEETKRRVREQYGGTSKAGEIGITAGEGMKIKEIGVNAKDADFAGLQIIAREAVAMVYHIPLPLISSTRQTLSNYKEAKVALYDDAVIPLGTRILGGVADFLLPRFGLDPRRATLWIDPDDVPALVSRRNDEMVKRKQINVETANELRHMIGREPVEGGDILYQPAAFVPAGSDLFTADNDPANPPDDEDPE